MAFADVSVPLFPSVTELSGWERTIKVAVTCHCMEVSTTSALPAVSAVTGAWQNREQNLEHFFPCWCRPCMGNVCKFCWEEPFVSSQQQVGIFTQFSTKVGRSSEKGHFSLSVLSLFSFHHLPSPDALHILPLGVPPFMAQWGFFYPYSKLIVALITGSRWCFAVAIWYFPPEPLEEDVIETAG